MKLQNHFHKHLYFFFDLKKVQRVYQKMENGFLFLMMMNNFMFTSINNFFTRNLYEFIEFLFYKFGLILSLEINDESVITFLSTENCNKENVKKYGFFYNDYIINSKKIGFFIYKNKRDDKSIIINNKELMYIYFIKKSTYETVQNFCSKSYVKKHKIELTPNKNKIVYFKLEQQNLEFTYQVYLKEFEYLYNPRSYQKQILDAILDTYNGDVFKVFLHGNTGIGKSEIGFLLAKYIESELYLNFSFACTNDMKYLNVRNKNKICIYIVNEYEYVMKRACENNTLNHDDVLKVKSLNNKQTFNDEWDYVKKFHKNIIFIFTTNIMRDELEKTVDTSFINTNRVNMYVDNVGNEQDIFVSKNGNFVRHGEKYPYEYN